MVVREGGTPEEPRGRTEAEAVVPMWFGDCAQLPSTLTKLRRRQLVHRGRLGPQLGVLGLAETPVP